MNEIVPIEPDKLADAPHPRFCPRVFGQDHAAADFLSAYNAGRLHHAWMITGPKGVGKASLAWKIARFLLSQSQATSDGLFGEAALVPTTLETPSDSPLAQRIAALAEGRLLLCRRPWDDKSNRLKQDITVSEVRRLKRFFEFSAPDGGRRVVIIDAADELNASAANALLKILEEPPERTTLLLVAHRPMRLLPTIRSRCRTLACSRLAADDMEWALAGAGFESSNIRHLAALADGSVGEAIRLANHAGPELYQKLVALFAAGAKMDRRAAAALADSCAGAKNAERYSLILSLLQNLHYRLAAHGASRKLNEAATDELLILGNLAPNPDAARRWATLAAELAARAQHAVAVNLDPSSVILDMLLKTDKLAGSLRAA